jgi:hypothetical protein
MVLGDGANMRCKPFVALQLLEVPHHFIEDLPVGAQRIKPPEHSEQNRENAC